MHPSVHPHVVDDFSKIAPLPEVVSSPNVVCLMPDTDDAYAIFVPHRFMCWEIHGGVLETSREHSLEYLRDALAWMKSNTPCRCVLSFVPKGNFRVFALDRAAGFKRVGVVEKCNPVSGELRDMTLMALNMSGET